jgi:hypothetical protein
MPATVWTLPVSWAFKRGGEEDKKTSVPRLFWTCPLKKVVYSFACATETSGMDGTALRARAITELEHAHLRSQQRQTHL